MRASEHENVGALVGERAHVALHQLPRFFRRQLSPFDLVGQSRARLNEKLHVAAVVREQLRHVRARECSCRRKHTDDARACARGGRLDCRFNCDDRKREAGPKRLNREGRCGVARNHHSLRAAIEKKLRHRHRALGDEIAWAVAIRGALRVGDVEQILVRQLQPNGPKDRQPSDTGVEHTNGRPHPQIVLARLRAMRCGAAGLDIDIKVISL